MHSYWNERYSTTNYLYGEQPNPQFKNFIDRNSVGKILLPGEGEGRNAVYAALQNWQVVALDQSSTAKYKAENLAAKHKVSIEYYLGDITENNFAPHSFDVIALVFFHLQIHLRQQIHSYLTSLLKDGGKLFVLGFSKDQIKYTSGGPNNIDMLYSNDMLANDFKELDIVNNIILSEVLNEGEGHKGLATLIEFEAIKNFGCSK